MFLFADGFILNFKYAIICREVWDPESEIENCPFRESCSGAVGRPRNGAAVSRPEAYDLIAAAESKEL